MECIHIVLTRTNSNLSRLIHFFTGDEYTHVAVGIDGVGGSYYGFGRKYARRFFPGCFRKETPKAFRKDAPCRIYELQVSDHQYNSIRETLQTMYSERSRYHFSMFGLFLCFLHISFVRKDYFFCSQFVAWLLQESGVLGSSVHPELIRPNWFCGLAQAEVVFDGVAGDWRALA